MIINKKYASIFLFALCSSASLFSAYCFKKSDENKDKRNKMLNYNSMSKEYNNEVYMPIIDKTFNTDFFNKSIILDSRQHKFNEDENIGFLNLNKNLFLEQLKTFTYKRIIQKNQSLLVNSDSVYGRIFYSFIDQNSINILVKWKNNNHINSQVFYDSWSIFIDY